MNETQLYTQLLGIVSPWVVGAVELNAESQEVLVKVETEKRGLTFACPECRELYSMYDSREERRWRHLDSCGFSTIVVARVPRVHCKEHGVITVEVPWSNSHSRYTVAFESFIIAVLQSTMVQAKAGKLLRLSSDQIHEVMHRAVARGLKRRQQQESDQTIKHLSLDEKSFRKGHHYVTVLGDSEQSRVLDVAEERTFNAAKGLLEQALTPSQRKKVESVTMDMWPAFMKAKEKVLPAADLVHDRFHVAKYLNEAVDQTRRQEQREFAAAQDGKSPLHGTKYMWLTRPENLSPRQRALLNTVRANDLLTAKAWAFKEAFRDFFNASNVTEARTFFINWFEFAQEIGCKPLTKVAIMLDDHLRGLLNYHFHHTTNATAEGINGLIQQIKANARGFRRFRNFRVAILFFLGKLDLDPQCFP